MRTLVLILPLFLIPFIVGCTTDQSHSVDNETKNVSHIRVTQDGTIFVNGDPTSWEALKLELLRLKQVKGKILYYRENISQPPSLKMTKVFTLLTRVDLPIDIYTQKKHQ